ncbi:MAG: hypothetical protein E7813_20565 [Bradyrhizobium sp.]|uniref:hypothetical protein n=1 Tax=Bradyrhizobium sp. TaxID=376 RepID=UPI0012293261|nr:hypothetical protein [Bradyrhizobium sp.]THD62323.1 MAG: hypothetical protein E7813_20565 [Bradyrhizobium sp.]
MSEQFEALPMDRQRASAAYPRVYVHDSGITLQKWLRFVGRRCHQTITVEQPFRRPGWAGGRP